MSDVFILGAGFSKEIADLPLMEELSNKILDLLDESHVKELRQQLPTFDRDNFETWLTYLSQSQPWLSEAQNSRNQSLFLEISERLSNVMEGAQQRFDDKWPLPQVWKVVSADNERKEREGVREQGSPGVYTERPIEEILGEHKEVLGLLKETDQKRAMLLDIVQYFSQHKVDVITLNYDTLVERCWATIFYLTHRDPWGRTYFEYPASFAQPGFPGSPFALGGRLGAPLWKATFPLYKLHGSLNWFYSGSRSFYGETIFCVRASAEESGHRPELLRDKVPLVIPPVMEKIPHFQHETIRGLWLQAGQALRKASNVYSVGYSLPGTDLTMQFFLKVNAPKGKIPLYIVSRNAGGLALKRYRELLGDTYDVRDDFTGSNAVQLLVGGLTGSKSLEKDGKNKQA